MKHYVGNNGIDMKCFPNYGWMFPCINKYCCNITANEYIYNKYQFKISICKNCEKCPYIIRHYKIYLRRFQYLKGVRYKKYYDDGGDIVILNYLIRVIS